MNISVGSDHAGFELKIRIIEHLESLSHQVVNLGAQSRDAYDYPMASDAVSCSILEGKAEFGILICGSGVGVCIRANRHKGIRAALCLDEEMARLARAHNHANILCLSGRKIELGLATLIVDAFLNGPEDRDERHIRRVAMFDRNVSCSE